MNPTADVRDLLAHADWLRRLAAHLVGRAGDPEDLVQQTWLAALRRPPAADRPARPWLAEVLRNFARKAHRDRRTREGREQSVAGDAGLGAAKAAPPAESLLEAAQLQRQLADLVLALDEPYRTTILLRFYQGIEPAEIARASGVPAGTVRWRVNEGIRRLRGSLDSAPEAGEWRRALLPFLGAAPAASPALQGGLLIMSTKAKLVAATIAVAALAVGAWTWSTGAAGMGTAAAVAPGSQSRSAQTAQVREGANPGSHAGGVSAPVASPEARSQPEDLARRRPTRPPPPRLVAVAAGTAPAPDPRPAERRGTLDANEVREAMRRITPALKQCYSRLLEQQPQSSGRLTFQFTITDQGTEGGRISEASIVPQPADGGTPELIDPLTEQCMVNAIAEGSFPSPQGGPVVVRYPFLFAPSGDHVPATPRSEPAPLR
jgi:RNA polymerase sigma-70 factor (ECF subfamily)